MQASDVVPAEYKLVAVCTDSCQFELSSEQQREAAARREEELSRARRTADTLPPAPSPVRPAAGDDRPREKRPTQVITDATDCQTWVRAYAESNECFGPYKTTRGGMKPEAFDACNVVPSPEPKCGPIRD